MVWFLREVPWDNLEVLTKFESKRAGLLNICGLLLCFQMNNAMQWITAGETCHLEID